MRFERNGAPALGHHLGRQFNWFEHAQFAASTAEEACHEQPDLRSRNLRDICVKWVCKRFTEIEANEKGASEAEGKRSATSGTFEVAINNRGEPYWLAVPSIEYARMNTRELSEALGLCRYQRTADRNQHLREQQPAAGRMAMSRQRPYSLWTTCLNLPSDRLG